MPRALEGMRVLDFTHMLAGPLTTNFLVQLGASVIKVETPGRGDHMRYYGPDRRYDGMSPSFMGVNAGKQSLAIDLKSPEGRAVIARLLAQADIVIENFRPGVADRLGIGFADAKALRPDIVYCSISAYGQHGERRHHAGVDNIVQATSGMMTVSGSEGDPPIRVGIPVIDMYAGTLAAIGILGAIVRRERTGEGQYIDTSMFDAALVLQTGLLVPTMVLGTPQPRTGNTGYSALPTAGLFTARDGRQISLGVVQQNQFEALARAIGQPELLDDPRFGELKQRNRSEHHAPLHALLEAAFASRDAEDWNAVLIAHGVPAGVVRTIADVAADPFLAERGIAVDMPIAGVPDGDRVRLLGAGFAYDEDNVRYDAPPPWLGEQTAAILGNLGYDRAAIDEMAARGVIGVGAEPR